MSVAELERDESRSIKERVYAELKTLILENQLHPGVKLGHEELSRRLSASRTPVREALERLSQERYVELVPNKGFFVCDVDIQLAGELYSMREALEVHALSLTMARGLTATELRPLVETVRTYLQLIKQNQITRRRELDRDFHLALAGHCGNGYLLASLREVFDKLLFKFRVEGYYHIERGMQAAEEHRALLDAIRGNRADEAMAVLRAHVRNAWVGFRKYLEETGRPL